MDKLRNIMHILHIALFASTGCYLNWKLFFEFVCSFSNLVMNESMEWFHGAYFIQWKIVSDLDTYWTSTIKQMASLPFTSGANQISQIFSFFFSLFISCFCFKCLPNSSKLDGMSVGSRTKLWQNYMQFEFDAIICLLRRDILLDKVFFRSFN